MNKNQTEMKNGCSLNQIDPMLPILVIILISILSFSFQSLNNIHYGYFKGV